MSGTVVTIDTQRRPEMARLWKVSQTPTTIWIIADEDGKAVEVSRSAKVVKYAELSRQYTAALDKRNEPYVKAKEREVAAKEFEPK